MSNWHTSAAADVLQQLHTDAVNGLAAHEAQRRLAQYGPNQLIERSLKSPWHILWEQFTATMVLVLIAAAIASLALGDYRDAALITILVVLNAGLGFSQDYRAERAMAALQQLAAPRVRVRRGGHVQEVSARELVPGDIVLLEAGNQVPADCRLLECVNLRIQAAALTGESEPVDMHADALPEDVPLGDRRNTAYMGTVVTYGRGHGIVTDTGMHTELGRIAALIQTVGREPTPLQRRLDQLGRRLAAITLAIVAVIFVLGLLRREDPKLMFLTAVSIAVAAVPEGLPAVVTIALALGAQRMLKRHALIRKLPAVETLGSVTVICSDKTGTLTENRMTVTVLDVAGHQVDLTGLGQQPERERVAVLDAHLALALLVVGGALCNDAWLETKDATSADAHAIGDPTETSLLVAAAHLGFLKADLERRFPRVAEMPFDAERKRMTTVHDCAGAPLPGVANALSRRNATTHIAFSKGAVDSLLRVTNAVCVDNTIEPLSDAWHQRVSAANDRLAQQGMRVLGVAFRPVPEPPGSARETLERDLVFIGMIGIIDPPRPDAKAAVEKCTRAGIRPVMITGDHALTARHVAQQLGIAGDGRVVTGHELDRLPADQWPELVAEARVYARVAPEHKLKIIEALQRRGHIVAMTGDGVNDAPALRKADIGVAMGITGTDVAKEAADMVLLDDNFGTIVAAVEEGRVIYDNIRKFIKYLLTTNSGELGVMLLAPFAGMPLPLLPLQILWINLVTDGPPALALSVEPAERHTMERPPHHPQESIFARGLGRHIVVVGLLMVLVSLGVGYAYWRAGRDTWQTMLFTTLALSQMGHVLAIRSERDSLFRIGVRSNTTLLAAVTLTLVLQMAVIYLPFLQQAFRTVALPAGDLAVCLGLSTVVFWSVELEKWLLRRRGS